MITLRSLTITIIFFFLRVRAWSLSNFGSKLSSREDAVSDFDTKFSYCVEYPQIQLKLELSRGASSHLGLLLQPAKKGTPVKGPFLGAAEIALPGVADAALRLGPALRLPGISVQLVRLPRGREDTGER